MPAVIQSNAEGTEHAFVSARIPAWHRLGTVVEQDGLTVEDAMKQGRLAGWEVETMPLVTLTHDGDPLAVDHRVATVRRSPFGEGFDVLGVVGTDYPVIQNEEAFGFLDALVEESDGLIQTAGAIGRARAFMTMRLPEVVKVGGEDATDLYLTAATSHDASLAFTTFTTPVRVVCQNTLTAALGAARGTYKVRHVGDATAKVAEAREALQVTFRYADQWQKAMEALLDVEMDRAEFDAMIAREFLPLDDDAPTAIADRVRGGRDALGHLFSTADTQEFGRNTRYAAFNAVSEWTEWVKPRDPMTVASAQSALDGATASTRQQALKVLLRA